mmetsp:Transcript_2922/g.3923  ORF Transcript_2922/g.3923 Transcript_2922/m.3923 type:complete len:231 (+) Transcript_2922:89-781(+)|eukprot:CAMPEP_0198144600 /NCGR_PEP_ID=MMETSP1443-20131203/16823_1 /TAXON_ID=186043 /ORGANISM="Entomoneis sp., Strain CCMP2396" /LENGTH=230 /DNA_ID=CAMNT_0043808017 /DNA_START=78 /DNA_END=770 /DNA_ORIENTATION=+
MAMGFVNRTDQSNLAKVLGDTSTLQKGRQHVPVEDPAEISCRRAEMLKSSKGKSQILPLRIKATDVSSSTAIRSRFLNRLGISKPDQLCQSKCVSLNRVERTARKHSFSEGLKGDYGTIDELIEFGSLSSISTVSTASSSSSEKSVSFDSTVTVHPIAKRTAYSDRIRATLWTSPTEMKENTARNCCEFAAESWDWRKVANDEDMVLYKGQPFHPVHFVLDFSLQCRFSP